MLLARTVQEALVIEIYWNQMELKWKLNETSFFQAAIDRHNFKVSWNIDERFFKQHDLQMEWIAC